MRKQLSALLLAGLACGTVSADDWTGWYFGLHGGNSDIESAQAVALGGQWSAESQALRNDVVGNWSTELDAGGSTFGLQFGYDHEFDGGFVLGIEFDYSWVNGDDGRLTGPTPTAPFPGLSYSYGNFLEVNDKWSIRPKLGVAFDNHLIYVTAGWASVDIDAGAEILSNGGYSKAGGVSDSLDGNVWGIGWEARFADNWSARIEYLSYDFDNYAFATSYRPGSTFVSPAYTEAFVGDFDDQVIRIGVNYRF